MPELEEPLPAAAIGGNIEAMVEVTDTAAAIARIREAESMLPPGERLFEDRFAHHFRGGSAADEVSERYLATPFFREGVRIRTRFIDDGVREALRDGAAQILIIGAGFDCRALRMREIADGAVPVFEVDFADQLGVKRTILEAAGVRFPGHLHLVPCDLAAPDFEIVLSRALAAAGFSDSTRTCMIWEGVINYLDEATIDRDLRWLSRAAAPGSRLLFNYNAFRFDPRAFAARTRAAGFSGVEDYGGDELFRRYLATEPPPCGELFRIGRAQLV